jgi:hypothetical protein
MKLESLSFSDRFDILLEKRLSSVAGMMYIMLYGKSQLSEKKELAGLVVSIFSGYRDLHSPTP